MMRYCLPLLLLFCACRQQAPAQCPPAQQVNSNYQFKAAGSDSGWRVPKRFTSLCWLDSGSVSYQRSDSGLYRWSGSQWIRVGPKTGSATTVNGDTVDLGGSQTKNVAINAHNNAFLTWDSLQKARITCRDSVYIVPPKGFTINQGCSGCASTFPVQIFGTAVYLGGETRPADRAHGGFNNEFSSISNFSALRTCHANLWTYGYEDYYFPEVVDNTMGLGGFVSLTFPYSNGTVHMSNDSRGGYFSGFIAADTWGAEAYLPQFNGYWALLNVNSGATVGKLYRFRSDSLNTASFGTGGIIDTAYHYFGKKSIATRPLFKEYGVYIEDDIENVFEGYLRVGDSLLLQKPIAGAQNDSLLVISANTVKRIPNRQPISGSVSTTGSGTTTFTVTIGSTLPSSTYRVQVQPTAALTAANFYVTNKTTTTFDVVYLAGLTGTVTFDWLVSQN